MPVWISTSEHQAIRLTSSTEGPESGKPHTWASPRLRFFMGRVLHLADPAVGAGLPELEGKASSSGTPASTTSQTAATRPGRCLAGPLTRLLVVAGVLLAGSSLGHLQALHAPNRPPPRRRRAPGPRGRRDVDEDRPAAAALVQAAQRDEPT